MKFLEVMVQERISAIWTSKGVLRVSTACVVSLMLWKGAMAEQVDRLDRPAEVSVRASRALMLSAARAGTRLIVVGERGIVLVSDDDGKQWRQAKVPSSEMLTDVTFPTANDGWAVGHDGVVLHSVDGGLNWARQFDGRELNAMVLRTARVRVESARAKVANASTVTDSAAKTELNKAEDALDDAQAGARFGPSRPLLGVWFSSANEGYAVGAYGVLLRTSDGGVTWQLLSDRLDDDDRLHLNAVHGLSGGCVGIAGEGGRVYRSCDNGTSWKRMDTGYRGQLNGVLSTVDSGLIAFGFGGHIFRLDANSTTWRELTSGTRVSIVDGAIGNDGRLVLMDQNGTLLLADTAVSAFHKAGTSVSTIRKTNTKLVLQSFTALSPTLQANVWLLVGRGGTAVRTVTSEQRL